MTLEEIKQTIEQAVPNSTAHVLDPMNDGQHLQALVISSSFENTMLIKQHKMVMSPLKEAFKQSVHALGLKTFTPAKWEEQKINFVLTESAGKFLAEKGYDPVYGARPLKRAIQQYIENPLAMEIIKGNISEGGTIKAEVRDENIIFT